MLTIHETMGMGIIAPSAVCDLRTSLVQLSTITAAAFLGIICSSYFWGYITDNMGRRWILLHTISISNICSVISMLMVSFTSFFVIRFLTGSKSANGLGICYTAMGNRSNMRQDNKTDMTFCKILFNRTSNDFMDIHSIYYFVVHLKKKVINPFNI
ncbi:GH17226 [Drosophila grimshawi]|uniref:GH17226 n=1 Tax=Drosophila grimshawi TaxID=7222 RepID=B4K1R6_DROGR|nr:GH17226 [Drosophila grimshawi]